MFLEAVLQEDKRLLPITVLPILNASDALVPFKRNARLDCGFDFILPVFLKLLRFRSTATIFYPFKPGPYLTEGPEIKLFVEQLRIVHCLIYKKNTNG